MVNDTVNRHLNKDSRINENHRDKSGYNKENQSYIEKGSATNKNHKYSNSFLVKEDDNIKN